MASTTGFSGVVRVDPDGRVELARAFGMAHRACRSPTRSTPGSAPRAAPSRRPASPWRAWWRKAGLDFTTTARGVLGDDLPLIDDDVTVEHLLGHRPR